MCSDTIKQSQTKHHRHLQWIKDSRVVKMMAFLLTEWRHVAALVSIFWLAAAEDNPKIELKTSPNITAQLGQNVTLPCEANLDSSKIGDLSWLFLTKKQHICKYAKENTALLESNCEVINGTSLILKLINVSPADQGVYMCKLRSMKGPSENTSTVTVQESSTSSPEDNSTTLAQLASAKTQETTSGSGNLVQLMYIMVGIIIVNLIMYC
ncbi:uncharacterized protein LOC116314603 [Oreochromis aureus]|uniref:uncharacterized protein LOC116314603 n=1 Tax=Oreochromis aureus TaxID=47969 RepID=UPI0012BD7AE5|nr:uncharacterized protein LOC116314603 [Oreochromis aureus]